MSCCGKAKKANTQMVYENGVKLIYSGVKQITFVTPNRNVYVFDSKAKKIQEVDPRDVDFLLSRYNKAFSMFRIYQEPIIQNMLPTVTVEEIAEELEAFTAQAEPEEVEEAVEEPVKKSRRKKKEE